jgi:hypothetical protein
VSLKRRELPWQKLSQLRAKKVLGKKLELFVQEEETAEPFCDRDSKPFYLVPCPDLVESGFELSLVETKPHNIFETHDFVKKS